MNKCWRRRVAVPALVLVLALATADLETEWAMARGRAPVMAPRQLAPMNRHRRRTP